MIVNAAAENALGTIGTILWTIQLIPQIWKSWRSKSTEGLSGALMLIWSLSAIFLGVYAIVQKLNIPLILQPQLFGVLSAFSWIQCLHYGRKISLRSCIVIFLTYTAGFGGLEAGLIFAVRLANRNGYPGVVKAFGIMSAVLISIGLIPQYVEIWKRKQVIGISLTFMAVDILGGIFSILSLVFREHFDAVAAVTYIAVIVLDGVIVIAAFILNPRTRRLHQQQLDSNDDTRVPGNSSQQPPRISGEGSTTIEGKLDEKDLEKGASSDTHGSSEKHTIGRTISVKVQSV